MKTHGTRTCLSARTLMAAVWIPMLLAGCASYPGTAREQARSVETAGVGYSAHALNSLMDTDGDGLPDSRTFQGPSSSARAEASVQQEPTAEKIERKLIYEGQLRLAVGDVDEGLKQAGAMAEDLGGYVFSIDGSRIVLRFPATRWEEGLARAEKLGRVLDRHVQVQDVTEQMMDLGIRLKNALALRERLQALLQKAESVEVALKIESELARVGTEIETLQGKLEYLRNRVALSTLTLELVQVGNAPQHSRLTPFPWLQELGVKSLLGL